MLFSIFTRSYNHHDIETFEQWKSCLVRNLFWWLKVFSMGYLHLHVCVHAFSRASADKILWNGLRGLEPAKLGRCGSGSHRAALALQPPPDSDRCRAQARGETPPWALRPELVPLSQELWACLSQPRPPSLSSGLTSCSDLRCGPDQAWLHRLGPATADYPSFAVSLDSGRADNTWCGQNLGQSQKTKLGWIILLRNLELEKEAVNRK